MQSFQFNCFHFLRDYLLAKVQPVAFIMFIYIFGGGGGCLFKMAFFSCCIYFLLLHRKSNTVIYKGFTEVRFSVMNKRPMF